MSFPDASASALGAVKVYTADHRGFTPEEIAERAADRIIYVGDQSHPLVAAQARAFKEQIITVLVHYLREAQINERATICTRLSQEGYEEIANFIRSL